MTSKQPINKCPYGAVKSCVHNERNCNYCKHKPPQKEPTPMDIRERLYNALYKHETKSSIKLADELEKVVLSDPDIKKGLELLELYKVGKIVKLADDQDLPNRSYVGYGDKREGYLECRLDMLYLNFKRIDKEWR